MQTLNESLSISFIVVTHDESLAGAMARKLELRDGILLEKESRRVGS